MVSKPLFGFRSRDIRATRDASRSLRCPQGGRSEAFAAAVAARHVRAANRFARIECVTRRRLARAIANHIHRYQVNAPRISIDARLTTVTRGKTPMGPFVAQRSVERVDALSTAASVHVTMLRRVLERERTEHTATIRDIVGETAAAVASGRADSTFALAGSRRVAEPVQMITRRSSVPAALESRTVSSAPARLDPSTPFTSVAIDRAADRRTVPQLNDRELGRVTDHVVHTLERRIISQRERHGRI